MRKEGSFLFILIILFSIFTFASPGVASDPKWAPTLIIPEDSVVTMCEADSVCFHVAATDVDAGDSLTLSLYSGPLDFTTTTFGAEFDTSLCFWPSNPGDYEFIWMLTDLQNHVVKDTVTFTVVIIPPPTIEDQYFAGELCSWESTRKLALSVDNPSGGELTWNLLSGPGSINATTGLLQYNPDTAGVYSFEVEVVNECGADTAMIYDTVQKNQPPELTLNDITVNLCALEEVCFDVMAADPEGLMMSIEQTEGRGQFTLLTDSTGQTCFLPDDVPSATYQFVYCLKDLCPSESGLASATQACPICFFDTVNVTVVINQPPEIVCAPSLEFFTCQEETFCFTVDANDADFDPVTFRVLSPAGATVDGNSICFVGSENDQFEIVVEAADTCGNADTCSIQVSVAGNRPPYVSIAKPMIVSPCGEETVCLAATADDPDHNLESVTVNYGSYDDATDRICLNVDTSGVYEITLTATDSCGASASATTTVTVTMNTPPVVDLGDDIDRFLCEPIQLCQPVTITDDNLDRVVPSFGNYNPTTSEICFTLQESGNYVLSVWAYDACGDSTYDEIAVNIEYSQPPFVELGPDFSVFQCDPGDICVDVTTIAAWESLVPSLGLYNPDAKQVCFFADTSGVYTLTVEVTDSCGLMAADTVNVEVGINSPPVIAEIADTSVYLCYPENVCLPLEVIDADGNIKSISVNRGTIKDGSICFVPYSQGDYTLVVTVVDSCGETVEESAVVHVETEQDVALDCPNDTTLFACDADTFCLPVGGIPDNGEVTVTGINTWYDAEKGTVCFYSECSNTNHITVSVTTPCGTYSCDFTVEILCNNPPVVMLPPDTAFFLCGPAEVCIPAGIYDLDDNIAEVAVNPGTYNESTDRICFFADTAGLYLINVAATDSCGEQDWDEIVVAVTFNTAPVCIAPDDVSLTLCGPTEVRVPISATDDDGNFDYCEVVSDKGIIVDGEWVYTPRGTEAFEVIFRCFDECGSFCESSFSVNFDVNLPPVASCPGDTTVFVCELGDEVCLTGFGAYDPDGNYDYSYLSTGYIDGDKICLVPGAGINEVKYIAVDSCGLEDTCTVVVNVVVNTPPQCDLPGDTTIALCDFEEICLPVNATDVDGNWKECVLVDGPGRLFVYDPNVKDYVNPQRAAGDNCRLWCYTPTKDTSFAVTIRCLDSCGAYCEGTFNVTIQSNHPPEVSCPGDTSIFICEPAMIGLGGFSAFDPDANMLDVILTGGTLWDDSLVHIEAVEGRNTIILTATDKCGVEVACTTHVDVTVNTAPSCDLPGDTTINLCSFDEVSLPVGATDVDGNFESCTLTSDFGELVGGFWNYTPTANDETVDVTVECSDSCGATCSGTFVVTLHVNTPPVIDELYHSAFLCFAGSERTFGVNAFDADGEALTYSLTSDFGSIDPVTGVISYVVDTAGVYEFGVEVKDSCAVIAATVTDTITLNTAPQVVEYDSTVYLCDPQEICFDVTASDPDGGVITITQTGGAGSFTQLTDTSGQTCFLPPAVDSATYIFTYCASDGCDADGDGSPECAEYTITITVLLDKPPVLTCPPEQSFFACGDEPMCFELIEVSDPEGGEVTLNILSGNATVEGTTVCLIPGLTGQLSVDIEAVDTCGHTATCSVPVTITPNRPPVVTVEDDFQTFLCEPGQVCFGYIVTDPDMNVAEVTASFGFIGIVPENICFQADTAGVYSITVTAVDSCGAEASAAINVTVDLNEAPVVDLGEDRTISLCTITEYCLPDVIVEDKNIKTINVLGGDYDPESGQLCFTPAGAGEHTISVEVVDSCGASAYDEIVITVNLAEPPDVSLGEDQDLFVCTLSEICIDVATIENFESISPSLGQYDAETGQVCFTPDVAGAYRLIVTVVDSCALSGADTVDINIALNSPPVLSQMPDTSVYLCYPKSICLPIDISDADDNITSIQVNRGSYSDGSVCFVPYAAGDYKVIVTVTDACGETVADTAKVTVRTDQAINLVCPNDTTIFTCELDTFCIEVDASGIPDYAEVTVRGINTWWDEETHSVCFYAECAVTNRITINVTTPCNTFSCEFNVRVECNREPLVVLPPDRQMTICEPTTLCLPVGVSDLDGNLQSVTVDGASYNASAGQVCFDALAAGSFTITVTAEDSCGAISQDEIVVTVVENTAPQVTFAVTDTTLSQCVPQEICLPIQINDADGNITKILVSRGEYDPDAGTVCFTPPDTNGTYCVTVIARDICGLADTAQACAVVEPGGYVKIECPTETISVDTLCEPQSVCVPLPISGREFSVAADFGTWSDGQLCFGADTSGLYVIEVTATAECNEVKCTVRVEVVIAEPVTITCPGNDQVFLCAADTLAYGFAVSSSVASYAVTAPAYIQGDSVYVPVLQAGNYLIMMTAAGSCGADTCSFTVAATFNSPPQVTVGKDTVLTVCELPNICLTFDTADVDDNIVQVTTSRGAIAGNQVCFTPPNFGFYTVTITATDECGAKASKTVNVTVNLGPEAQIIQCPTNQFRTICGADSVCITGLLIWPFDAQVTVLPNGHYNADAGQICVYIEESGTYEVSAIVKGLCGADTCSFDLQVDVAVPPAVTCPAQLDTLMCLAEPQELCFDVEASGTGLEVKIEPVGTYSAGVVCVPIEEAGTYEIDIIASGVCGVDTCTTVLNVTADEAPELFLSDYLSFYRCDFDTNAICIDGLYARDKEADVTLTLTQVLVDGSPATAEINFELAPGVSDSGEVCFRPDQFGAYEFFFEADDGCQITSGSFIVDIFEKDDCDVCVHLEIEGGDCTPVGLPKNVQINIETNQVIGGFVVLISYDASVVSFQTADIDGSSIDGWEYFVYRLNSASCGSACPSGLVRFTAIADVNNGDNHPPVETLKPEGVLIDMQYLVANDQNLSDQFLPISFVWYDCGDNTFSDPTGNYLYVENRIYNAESKLIWDEDDDIKYPDALRPFGLGTPDSCVVGSDKAGPERCVEFVNGGICVIHADSIDFRGDVNLNNISYEIADVVVFTNYFIYGLSAFTINLAGQIAATDVNADGLTLSVADLVYLIRVVVGDADPIPKLVPYDQELVLTTRYDPGLLSLSSQAVSSIGGALLVYEIPSGLKLAEPSLARDAEAMSMVYVVKDNELRVLLYSLSADRLAAGRNDLVEIPFSGEGRIRLVEAQFVDYQGRPYRTVEKRSQLPGDYALHQNYPNPFNPATNISFVLPMQTRWNLSIFNITGALVREFDGTDEAGTVTVTWDGRNADGAQAASGVYLYRLKTEDFSATKKMILLK